MSYFDIQQLTQYIVPAVLVIAAIILLVRGVRIVSQASSQVIERLGKYHRTLEPGLNFILPIVDRALVSVDMRERVVSFPPQPVITQDNLVVSIDTVVFFQVTDAKSATYEIQDFVRAIEQLTVTTLRNLVGGLDLEQALTSRDSINAALRGVLDEATGKWGVRVNRVELKAIDPPPSVQESMEKQMRAEREKRAVILTAEGEKQSQILTAEGARQADILRAEGEAKAAVLRAEGEAEAVAKIFKAVHAGKVDSDILAYLYMQQLPQIANGTANKVWMLPAELSGAIEKITSAFRSTPKG